MNNRKLLALFLSIAMAITMMPLAVFADEPQQTEGEAGPQILTEEPTDDETSDGEAASPVEGTKENPYVMYYWRNRYYCDPWTDGEYEQKEIWIKLETRAAVELAFEAYAYGGEDYLRSATMYDSDMKTVIYKFDYNDGRYAYETEKLQLNKQTYYFKLKFSDIPYDQGCTVASIVEQTTTPEGTFENPIIIKQDLNTTADELEEYYTDDYFYLGTDTQSVYYKLDAFKTEYYSMNFSLFNEVGVKSVKILDSNRKEIQEFEKHTYEGALLPDDYVNYCLDNFKLEKGKTYYIEVLIDKSVENDAIELNIWRLDGNGLKDNPFKMNYLPSDWSEWYYGYGMSYKGYNEYWFKANIEKDAKIKVYAGAGIETEESLVDEMVLYLPGDASGVKLDKNEYGVYCTEDYIPVKKGDVVWIKAVLNDKATPDSGVYAQLDCFGLTDMDVNLELECDQYTWDGKEHKPGLAYIKYKDTDLIPDTDYEAELKYNNTVNMGYNEVSVVGKGDYQGMRFLYFAINPKGTKLTSVSPRTKSMKVNWKKQDKKMSVDRITGYEIQYSTSKKFASSKTKTAKAKGYKNTSKTIKKLKSGKKYYVRVRTYYYDEYTYDYVYSTWSAPKSVRVK